MLWQEHVRYKQLEHQLLLARKNSMSAALRRSAGMFAQHLGVDSSFGICVDSAVDAGLDSYFGILPANFQLSSFYSQKADQIHTPQPADHSFLSLGTAGLNRIVDLTFA